MSSLKKGSILKSKKNKLIQKEVPATPVEEELVEEPAQQQEELEIEQIDSVDTKQKFTIFCGSYEGAIIGLAGNLSKLELKYAFKPSTNSLKCMDISGKFLVIGGFDEYLRIYDLKRQREVGILDSHIGTITSIKSHQSIVFSCAEDGLIKAWKMKEFGLLHTLKDHKDSVNDIAVHKSGKILVSVSKDKRLIIWNLISAQKVFVLNLKYNAYKVEITEKHVITMSDFEIHVIDLETNREICELSQEKKVTLNDFCVFEEKYVVVGDNNGYVYIYDIETKHSISFQAHETRVKKLQVAHVDDLDIIVTISTSGEIHIFDTLIILRDVSEFSESKVLDDVKPIYKVNTLNRLTSLSIYMDVAKDKVETPSELQLKAAEESRKQAEILRKQEEEKKKRKKNQKKVKVEIEGETKAESRSFVIDSVKLAKKNLLKKKKNLKKKLQAEQKQSNPKGNQDSKKQKTVPQKQEVKPPKIVKKIKKSVRFQ